MLLPKPQTATVLGVALATHARVDHLVQLEQSELEVTAFRQVTCGIDLVLLERIRCEHAFRLPLPPWPPATARNGSCTRSGRRSRNSRLARPTLRTP